MGVSSRYSIATYATLLVLLIFVTPARAQAAANAQSKGTKAQSKGANHAIEEVVVTAQRVKQNIQEVPASVSALNSSTIHQLGITNTSDLQFIVPSLQVGSVYAGTNVTIRGIGDAISVNGGPPAVATYVDGVYLPSPQLGDLSHLDLQRIEVLRGPQGTLYGRNATGGAIKFITAPPTNRLEGYVQAGVATYNQNDLQGVVNVPINDRIRVRAAIDWIDQREGFVKNILPGGQNVDKSINFSSRFSVAADLTNRLKLDLSVSHVHGSGPTSYTILKAPPSPAAIAATPIEANIIFPNQPWRTSADNRMSSDTNYTLGIGTLTWSGDNLHITSITGWQYLNDQFNDDEDASNINLFPAHRAYGDRVFSENIQVNTSLGPVDVVGGGNYFHNRQNFRLSYIFGYPYFGLPAGTGDVYDEPSLKTTGVAGFINGTWNVTDRIRLIGGFRVFKDTIKISNQDVALTLPGGAKIFICPPSSGELAYQSVTGSGGVQYDVAGNSQIYATISKGFKDGGFSTSTCNQRYYPEHVTSYEVGIKNTLLDDALVLNAAAYFYNYTNLQLSQQVGLHSLITNAATAQIKGLEFEGIWRPSLHWTFNATLAFTHAIYTSFINEDQLNPGLGFQNLAGNYLDNAPKENTNVGVAYNTDVADWGSLTLRANISQRSDVYFREFNTPIGTQKGYSVVNLALIWNGPNDSYSVRLWANNVTNKYYFTTLYASAAFGSTAGQVGAPRQVGIELRKNF